MACFKLRDMPFSDIMSVGCTLTGYSRLHIPICLFISTYSHMPIHRWRYVVSEGLCRNVRRRINASCQETRKRKRKCSWQTVSLRMTERDGGADLLGEKFKCLL